MIITDTMIEAGARIHNPFAFDGDAPLHRAQSRDEARREVHAILSAALAAAPAVGGEREALRKILLRLSGPHAAQLWDIRQIAEGALAAPPASPLRGRETISQDAATIAQTAHVIINQLTKECEKLRDEITHLAAPPASPLRGRKPDEWELAKFLCEKLALEDFDKMSRTKYLGDAKAVLEFLSASSPEQPASPLRGRLNRECLETLNATDDGDPAGNLANVLKRGFAAMKWAQPSLAADALIDALSASPEQPAAYPSAEADEAHADLLRRLAAVPKEEKE